MLKPNNSLSCILASLPCKFNLGNGHCVTTKNIATLSNFMCIEKYLTNLTCKCKRKCNKIIK